MKEPKQPSMWHYGKTKGFIFTLDTIIAALILIIVLVIAQYFNARAAEDKLALIQPLNMVSDTLTFLDTNGTLKTKDTILLQNELQSLLPQGFETRVQIKYSSNTSVTDIGNEIPSGVAIASGKRYFSTGTEYAVVRFWIWPKA